VTADHDLPLPCLRGDVGPRIGVIDHTQIVGGEPWAQRLTSEAAHAAIMLVLIESGHVESTHAVKTVVGDRQTSEGVPRSLWMVDIREIGSAQLRNAGVGSTLELLFCQHLRIVFIASISVSRGSTPGFFVLLGVDCFRLVTVLGAVDGEVRTERVYQPCLSHLYLVEAGRVGISKLVLSAIFTNTMSFPRFSAVGRSVQSMRSSWLKEKAMAEI
jgi:hypothetical protein